MGRMCNEMEETGGFFTWDRRMIKGRNFAVRVRRKDCMDCASVYMTRIPVVMISLGMDMKEWDHEHPRDQPEHGKYTNSCHA